MLAAFHAMGQVPSSTVKTVINAPTPAAALPPVALLPPSAVRAAPTPPEAEPVITRFSDTCRQEQQASLRCQTRGFDRGSRLEACVVLVDSYKRCMEEARKRRLAENSKQTGGDGSVASIFGKS